MGGGLVGWVGILGAKLGFLGVEYRGFFGVLNFGDFPVFAVVS